MQTKKEWGCGFQPAFQTEVTDSSGAGDAFFSGTVMGLIRNRPLGEAVIYGTRVAYWTIQVEENTNRSIPARIREEKLFMNVISLPEKSLKQLPGDNLNECGLRRRIGGNPGIYCGQGPGRI